MTDFRHVMIFGEVTDDGLASITKELVTSGRKLADSLGEELHVIFVGHDLENRAKEAFVYGVQKVYTVDDPSLGTYCGDSFTGLLAGTINEFKPKVVLFGHTDVGADLGPRLAFKLNKAITTDCVSLEVDGSSQTLLRTKPVNGGLAMAVFSCEGFPQMATVRAKSTSPADPVNGKVGELINLSIRPNEIVERTKVIGRVKEETKGVKLEDAEVIVSGGRGMGGADGFEMLETMRKLVNGAIGGSRVAVDNGWIPTSSQVGLTGTIVAPRVYIAVGISGASQHMTGCARSQRIIAINKDAAAPIFKQAHFGIVGDWKIVLPAFMDKLKELG